MRPLIFLFPHDRMDVGGNSAQARFLELALRFTEATAAFYGSRVAKQPHLDDYTGQSPDDRDAPIFVIHWGPDVGMLLDRLKGRDVVYIAHSTGWGMALPPHVPILCVSRHTLAFWGRHAPNSYLAYLPNVVSAMSPSSGGTRDIDVLVQVRKSSRYVLDRLVPALRTRCSVTVLDSWVDDLPAWFSRSRVYLYDSLEHWVNLGATEGFGLPPLEALAHGCVVFSSMNDALADYLDPGFNCRKIRVHSLAWDVEAILKAVDQGAPPPPPPSWFDTYHVENVVARMQSIMTDIETFFGATADIMPDIESVAVRQSPSALVRLKKAARALRGEIR